MGFRFQKRISILPGVRLNLSKSGASWSVGPRGASVNIGKRGIFGNVGIPGTGLSYRERLDKPAGRASAPARPSAAASLPDRVVARMTGDEVVLLDPQDRPLDPELVPAAKRLMKDDLKVFLDDHAADRNTELQKLRFLHHDIPRTTGSVTAGNAGKPSREQFFDQQSYMDALMRWRAEQANSGPDADALADALLVSLGALDWPAEINIALAVTGGRVLLDVDLPEIEDMPDATWKPVYTRLELVQKPMTKKDHGGFYLDHVCSILMRLAGHSFATSADIKTVALSAYTQRAASTGRVDDEYVATAEITRAQWAEVDLSGLGRIDPHQLLRRFGAKIETNARGKLLVQTPLS
ncbi:DUF4236 domain-containing protein [Croceicoccus mobilis]|uniref:DUF4236 domain-containing protein n=1 Tax=Croceicoccus mobilis TaxID=1703339 RepID=A0A916YQD5_9SPHN|nr:DUF4236 domain-containing protein [Croceicoccus mobilis]GGD56214.1 hypothetical protein GCM10010990_01770 [Croceicoccus mobilis]